MSFEVWFMRTLILTPEKFYDAKEMKAWKSRHPVDSRAWAQKAAATPRDRYGMKGVV